NDQEHKIKDAHIAEQAAISAKQKAEIKTKHVQQYALFGMLALLLIITFLIQGRFKSSQKKKKIIEKQHLKLEETHQDLTDSITYAKRIQKAVLPSEKNIQNILTESFVLYMPKDIVAGDFYWVEKKEDSIIFAAADCTGHGVPGALVSVLGNNALNRSVREYHLTDPGKILDKSRELMIGEFEKSEEEVLDGMDIALCKIIDNKLFFAGANNPLWVHRNNEIIEINGDNQPIGKYNSPYPFNTHCFELQKNDIIYLFSDGYADQFGGDKNKKFKKKNLRLLIKSIASETMVDQKQILEENFNTWKGENEQIDDVCIMGVKI
ncbi:MAG: SpoIIE family protein phosphatase, partial [Flavobacteriales bacterium]|nr:SpoIIE family protein phosphatase [Flavobacteriales bacterium]